jgi:hypothetical protein
MPVLSSSPNKREGLHPASWRLDMPSASFDPDANWDADEHDNFVIEDAVIGSDLADVSNAMKRANLVKPLAVRPTVNVVRDGISRKLMPEDAVPQQRSGSLLHTPRVAAARRDLYAAVNDQKAWNSKFHNLDSIFARTESASGSALASPHNSSATVALCNGML